jgi:predicted component of type VI protein secretion system
MALRHRKRLVEFLPPVPRYSPAMSQGMARLEVVAGRAIGMSVLLDDELLIGRHADGAGRLADDEEISRSHARISIDGSGFCAIEDLGSTNGTFVNGLRISGPQTLAVGDTLEVGGTTLVVREVPEPTRGPRPDASSPQGTAANQETPRVTAQRHAPAMAQAPRENGDQATPPPSLSLRLNVDFAAREATIALDENSEPIRLVFDGDAWRPAPS